MNLPKGILMHVTTIAKITTAMTTTFTKVEGIKVKLSWNV